ncbi:MAG TPA: 6-carboxytetrahydropterin synthase [Gemmatimonadales bacterium]|jgi:6-pyruvoyltetrahydropterin/6-carboxytetrahydropterin synthase
MGSFRVNVSKQYLGFAAAHFITFRGHLCESLHGHNYRVAVTAEGEVDPECHFVIDFAILKRVVRAHADALDHRVLLPSRNPKLAFRVDGDMTLVDYLGRQTYQFPTRDCVMLPIANSTAEMIAEWLASAVRRSLAEEGISPQVLEIEVEESPGQSAFYREIRGEQS